MSTFRHPVGPQSAKVYWRRRLVVGLGLLAVIIVIILIVVRPGAADDSSGAAPAPTESSAPAAPPSGDPQPCDPGSVELAAVTDKDSYQPGERPQLSLSLTNTGEAVCTVDASVSLQEFVVTSGAEQFWTSRDCQVADTTATVVPLTPGEPLSTTPIEWDRTRSSADTCDGQRDEVTAGGASYHLTVRVGELESANTKQFLLY